jgi:peptidoglycan/LPS O-acetylase OafA/YrhL
MSKTAQNYIPQLDGIRACAIVAVFLYHSPFHLKGGWMGVDLFFVLSGFLITRILVAHRDLPPKQYFTAFYERRALRIIPPYALLLIVTSLFVSTSWLKTWYMYIGAMNYPRTGPGTLSMLWSLAVEEQFYLVWPFVILFFARKRLPTLAAALIVAAPILRGLFTPLLVDVWSIYKLTPFRMDCLAAGALIGLVWENHKERIARVGALWLVPAGLGFATLLLVSRVAGFGTADYTLKGNVVTYELSLLIAVSVMLWALSDVWTGLLKVAIVRWIGQISYSLYLIHITAYTLVEQRLHGGLLITLGAAGLSLSYAAASWYLLERPLLSAKKKRAVKTALPVATMASVEPT